MAGPSYFEQLKSYLASAQSDAGASLSLANPNDPNQVVDIALPNLPTRPEGWPEGLPEPVMLEGANAAGMAFVTGDDGAKYLLFRDAESGQPIAMSYEDIIHLTDSLMRPIFDEAKASGDEAENAVLLEQLRVYASNLNDAIDRDSSTGVNFGGNIPVAEITAGGVIAIREYNDRPAPKPAAENVVRNEMSAAEVRRGRVRPEVKAPTGVIVEGPEEDLPEGDQDVIPQATADYVLANELAGLAAAPITAIDTSTYYNEGKGVRVLEAIRRNLGTPPDPDKVADYFDGRDEYKQIEESWRPIAAKYIQDSVDAGYALPLSKDSPYRQALDALEDGRIADANTLLAGGAVSVPERPAIEGGEVRAETEVYNPGRVEDDVTRIEPAAGGDEVDADEAALRMKVENTAAQIEGLLAAAGENDGGAIYEMTMALQVQTAIAGVRSNFADAVAENGMIDISKLPVNGDFGEDFTADDKLRQLAERLNTLNEEYGSIDPMERAREMDAHSPGP